MTFKQNMIAAMVMSALTMVLFVVASPLVPMASIDVWIVIALVAGAVATVFWIAALQTRSVEETGSTDI